MQIILPSIIAGYFLRNNYRTGVQFGLSGLDKILLMSVFMLLMHKRESFRFLEEKKCITIGISSC